MTPRQLYDLADTTHSVCGAIAQLIVGQGLEERAISVPECLLRAHSPFFDAALKKCWQDGSDKKIPLHEDYLDVVEPYVQFLYSGKIYYTKSLDDCSHEEYIGGGMEYDCLAELYVFGERIQDTLFKNKVMDAFIARMLVLWSEDSERWFPQPTVINTIYSGTTKRSSFRRPLVDITVSHGFGYWFPADDEDHRKDFLVDVASVLFENGSLNRIELFKGMDMVNYHDGLD